MAKDQMFIGAFMDEELWIKWRNFIATNTEMSYSNHIREAIRAYIDDDSPKLLVAYDEELRRLRNNFVESIQKHIKQWSNEILKDIV